MKILLMIATGMVNMSLVGMQKTIPTYPLADAAEGQPYQVTFDRHQGEELFFNILNNGASGEFVTRWAAKTEFSQSAWYERTFNINSHATNECLKQVLDTNYYQPVKIPSEEYNGKPLETWAWSVKGAHKSPYGIERTDTEQIIYDLAVSPVIPLLMLYDIKHDKRVLKVPFNSTVLIIEYASATEEKWHLIPYGLLNK